VIVPDNPQSGEAIPVVAWDVRRVSVIDENGAGEATMIHLVNANNGDVLTVAMDDAVAAWMAWAVIGVSGGLMESYGVFTTEDDE